MSSARRVKGGIEDQMQDLQVWELADGRRVLISGEAARRFGALQLLFDAGLISDPTHQSPRPVYQGGRLIGSLPGDFDPHSIRSRSFLYDPRPGDFTEYADGWLAARSLGLGDLLAIPGFMPAEDRAPETAPPETR